MLKGGRYSALHPSWRALSAKAHQLGHVKIVLDHVYTGIYYIKAIHAHTTKYNILQHYIKMIIAVHMMIGG